jgi:hypothetical protein
MGFLDYLRPPAPGKGKAPPEPATAAELAAALAEAEAESAERRAAEVAQERAVLLLAADDQQLDDVDRRLRLAQREADRAEAAVARRMADAQAAIDQANARLRRTGDPRLVADLDAAARPNRSSYQTLRRALWTVLVLPCPTRPFDLAWPPHVTDDPPPAPEQPPPRPSEGEPYAPTPGMARW